MIGRSCYTCLPRTAPTAAQTALKMAPGTGTDASRYLNVYSRSQCQNKSTYTHTCKQEQKLRNSTTIHENSNKTMLELFYALQRSRGHKERLKRS